MEELPHTVIVLIPTRNRLSWLNESGDEPLELKELTKDNTAVLVPEFETKDELERFLRVHWVEIFETELEAWMTENCWPKNRSYEMFREFFEVKTCSMVYRIGGQTSSNSQFGRN